MQWEKTVLPDGREAAAPVVISASRATDLPAFYSRWFAARLQAGWLEWRNPYNGRTAPVSLARCRLIVFWSKNPAPLLPLLPELERAGVHSLFQFTLNDYEQEGWEPGVPPLEVRIRLMHTLASLVGPERISWRFDPLIISDRLGMSELLERVDRLAVRLRGAAARFVFSFADISRYRHASRRMAAAGALTRPFTADEITAASGMVQEICRRTGFTPAVCASGLDLTPFGIPPSRCIDGKLAAQLWPGDAALMEFLGVSPAGVLPGLFDPLAGYQVPSRLRDRGQRPECGCLVSKDIGRYNSCGHGCLYCYANHADPVLRQITAQHDPSAPGI